jgi:hypothetical protein
MYIYKEFRFIQFQFNPCNNLTQIKQYQKKWPQHVQRMDT